MNNYQGQTMKNIDALESIGQIDIATEQRMTHKLERIALAMLSVGLASTLLTAFTALNALAAQPGAANAPTTRSVPAAPLGAIALATPGTLTGVKAAATVEMNTPLTFNFSGFGHCKLSLNSGDGLVTEFNGHLSFSAPYTYSSATMSSFETFKDYTATITPMGNCKTSGAGPFTTKVRVVNPHPQGAGAPPQDNTVVMAGSGKLNIGLKPGTVDMPSVAATIASIVFAGGPSAAAGAATVLTVNGTGNCKYHLSYVNLDAQGNMIMKAYPMLTKTSSAQSPFPMTMALIPTTPAGVYKWSANGVEGCTGTANAVLTVQ
jgi:hypothetical protein